MKYQQILHRDPNCQEVKVAMPREKVSNKSNKEVCSSELLRKSIRKKLLFDWETIRKLEYLNIISHSFFSEQIVMSVPF